MNSKLLNMMVLALVIFFVVPVGTTAFLTTTEVSFLKLKYMSIVTLKQRTVF